MKIQSINDPAFLKYGKVLTGYDLDGLIAAMDSFEIPDDVVYVASSPELERLSGLDSQGVWRASYPAWLLQRA